MAGTTRSKAARTDKPGPRNPEPLPATDAEGCVTVPSEEDVAAGAVNDDPKNPVASGEARARPAKTTKA